MDAHSDADVRPFPVVNPVTTRGGYPRWPSTGTRPASICQSQRISRPGFALLLVMSSVLSRFCDRILLKYPHLSPEIPLSVDFNTPFCLLP